MKLLLSLLAVILILLFGGALYLFSRLKRAVTSSQARELRESFEGSLAIPMRDCATTRTSRRDS